MTNQCPAAIVADDLKEITRSLTSVDLKVAMHKSALTAAQPPKPRPKPPPPRPPRPPAPPPGPMSTRTDAAAPHKTGDA